jgi:hypothetical protein
MSLICPNIKVKIMKNASNLILSLLAAGFALAVPGLTSAQNKDVPPPPKLEKVEELQEADLKAIKPAKERAKTVERREGGRVTEVEVRTGKSTYTVKPNQAPKGTPEGDANHAAMFKVMEFGGKKEAKEVEPLPVLPVGPHTTSKTGTTKPVPVAAAASAATSANSAPASAAVTEKK